MLNYHLPAGMPAGSRAAWSRLLLQPLAADLLTPLSYSILAEVAGRAWFVYYDKLAFDPIPRARLVRQSNGRAYFNLTLSAQREAEFAAVAPLTLVVDGTPQPLVQVEKQGLLAGMKSQRAARRIEKGWAELNAAAPAQATQAVGWAAKVAGFRWTQADILLVMEEIEPEMTPPFVPFLAARQGVLLAVNRLMRLANQPPSETLRQIDRGVGSAGIVEAEMARRLARMGQSLPQALRAWIEAGALGDWAAHLRDAGLSDALQEFLQLYGHRAPVAAELAAPRFAEDPAPLLRLLAQPPAAPAAADDHPLNVLLAAVDVKARKEAQEAIDALRTLAPLQSRALDTLSHYLAGARRFAWGASHEAQADQRIAQADDIFFFELEEIKRLMTNEWNVSDRAEIQSTAAKRRTQYEGWRNAPAPALLLGDAPTEALDRLEPSPVLDPAAWLLPGARPRSAATDLLAASA